MNPFFN